MKRKPAIHTHHAPHFYVLFAVFAIALGILGTVVVTKVLAQTAVIYSCVTKTSGAIRIVDGTITCKSNENPLSWNQEGTTGGGSTVTTDKQTKTLVNNTPADLFNFPLADGETWGGTMYLTLTVKRGSDWSVSIYQIQRAFYNNGGVLRSTTQSMIAGDIANNSGTFDPICFVSASNALTATINSGIVTLSFSPGACGSTPDSIAVDYFFTSPSGKTLTFLP